VQVEERLKQERIESAHVVVPLKTRAKEKEPRSPRMKLLRV